MKPKILVLWDIDRTLMWADNAGEHALVSAAKTACDADLDLNKLPYSGRTDRWIAQAILNHCGHEHNEDSERRFLECYIKDLAQNLKTSAPVALPGVEALVKQFDQEPSICQALLTGNLAAGGKLKLDSIKLWPYFAFGAFADHSSCRNDLSPHALELAREHTGTSFSPQQVFVIGDTPHDIECGKIIGARTVAVATGSDSFEELSTHQPDLLLESLEDPKPLLEFLNLK